METILQLGEASDRLYFLTEGEIGVFVQTDGSYHSDDVITNTSPLRHSDGD